MRILCKSQEQVVNSQKTSEIVICFHIIKSYNHDVVRSERPKGCLHNDDLHALYAYVYSGLITKIIMIIIIILIFVISLHKI